MAIINTPMPNASAAQQVIATGGTAGAVMVLIEQLLWNAWGISLTNETSTAIMMLLPSVLHSLSECIWCRKFLGLSLNGATLAVPVAVAVSETTLAKNGV